ncbi:hypothetical protein [Falsirhodobacter algicola]|uniref:Anti-sigma factor NepR domain-containing protein n=1 Tax=Falsirhodobacter algicola TaxID=2692330 RepID=A0A8J8SL68_9RHOB|nr:hypothetical protein [Falsirhodobacter algicola]QUS36730.1 hypothetical protein GR316_10930 [Falsirhodobacter algicola]
MQAQDVPAQDLDEDLSQLAADLLAALKDEPVPPAILDLAARLQAALRAVPVDEPD